ncbi:hypothetical protein [Absidia glauca]|uniref:Uncharacterized protein n=1 Tax=Absidia glauca TaxID=4829 RepID=A0A163K0D5_ABSGL|nr:hypothetical protein [Absidia glauca]
MWCNGVGNGGEESRQTVSKASAGMDTGIRPKDSALQQYSGYGIYYGRAFLGDIKQWAGRHRRHRLRYRRRQRRSRSKSRK